MLTDQQQQQHPVTPPEELVQEWSDEWYRLKVRVEVGFSEYLATQAARWGADQELEACCEWLSVPCPSYGRELRAARRPKPPSLAKQGCDALDTYIYGNPNHKDKERTYNTIRAALERLQELESNGKV